MAQFLNQEVDPQTKASAKGKANPGTAPNETKLDWSDATDQGVAAHDRAVIREAAMTPATSMGQSFLAGAQTSIIATAIRKASAPDFPVDDDFDPKKVMPNDPAMKVYAPDQEEIEWLQGSKSPEEYNYRTQEMLNNRQRMQDMSQNTVSGIAGAIVGDAPLMLAPMGAAGVAGRVGLAIRTGIRAADVGSALYAVDQPGQSNTVAGVVAAVAGLDQLFDMARVSKAVARATRTANPAADADAAGVAARPKFDPDAPTKRSAMDTEVPANPAKTQTDDWLAQKLKGPIKVAQGQQAKVTLKSQQLVQFLKGSDQLSPAARAILDVIEPVVGGIDTHLTGNTAQRSGFTYRLVGDSSNDYITLRAAKAADGQEWNTVGDALGALDGDTANIAVHELVHAATSRAIRDPANAATTAKLDALVKQIAADPDLPASVKYYASNPHEALAGLANSPDWVEYLRNRPHTTGKSTLRQLGEYVMNALGFKKTGSALESVLGHFEDLVRDSGIKKDVPEFRSSALAYLGEDLTGTAAQRDEKLLGRVRNKMVQSFSLYDNIAAGNKDIADLLVSDGAAVGARRPAVADYKRNLTLELDAAASVVDDATVAQLRKQGVNAFDRFFHRSNFRAQRSALEDKFAKYLDLAYNAEQNGRAIPVPDDDISGMVQAYRESGWATRWYDHAKASGLVDEDAFKRSEYYFPRQYSYDRIAKGLRSGFTEDDYRALFRAALRDISPDMDSEVAQRVAREMFGGIYNGRGSQSGPMWRSLVNGVSNDELIQAMHHAGIDEDAIQSFIKGNIRPDNGKTTPVRNMKSRTSFNMTKEYMVNGKSMRMADLMDTDVAKVMHGYTNRMSGRVALAYAGVGDLRQLAKQVDEAKHAAADPDKWAKVVDDTIDYMLGGVVGSEMPKLLRAAGNLANATMLKNSGLYQITDTALAMKEFGMARVFRSMAQQPWFKEGKVVLDNPSMAARLDSILRGSIQKEMRFRWLNTYADDNLDLTHSSNWFNVTQNIGQTAKHVNGMSMVHRAQVNLNAGIVMDEIKEMLKGGAEASGRLEKWGLSKDLMGQMQAAYKANPDAMLPSGLQMQLEVAGTRMMDYLVQQVRTGETSYFAQMNPVGRVVVGYQSFALAATNKILRRTLNDTGPVGLMHLMAYQFPLMALATQAKYAMDGKLGEQTPRQLITESVLGMSAIGGISLISDMFLGNSPRHSLTSTGYVTGALGALQDIASGKADAQSLSRVLPLVQEFAPTRAVINNFGDE